MTDADDVFLRLDEAGGSFETDLPDTFLLFDAPEDVVLMVRECV